MKSMMMVCLALMSVVNGQLAHADATELTVQKSITIEASADVVWKLVGDFNGLPNWHPLLVKSRIILGENNRPGCVRELVRANATKINEKLLNYDGPGMSFEYTAVSGTMIATDYFSTISVRPSESDGGKSVVEWKGRFKRKAYWTDEPPEGQDDKFSTDVLTRAYTVGLDALKAKVESAP